MRTHPYLRAYMAGITVPTMFLLVVMTVFSVLRFGVHVSVPIERVIVFPMAFVPNAWGLWNVIYLRSHPSFGHSLGVHGALLVALLAPLGLLMATLLVPSLSISWPYVFLGFGLAAIVYYLVWKHVVGFLNAVLGVA